MRPVAQPQAQTGCEEEASRSAYWYLMLRTPDALADVHAAAERQIANIFGG